jgi:hypothetical protein
MTLSNFVKGQPLDQGARSLSTVSYAIAACGTLLGIFYSDTPLLWALAVISLPVAISLSAVGARFPIILLHLALVWLPIFATILNWDLQPAGLADSPEQWNAILLSLVALLAIALGYRFAMAGMESTLPLYIQLNRKRLLQAYLISFLTTGILFQVAYYSPALTQPVLAFRGVRLLLLYLLCAQIFSDRKGYAIVAFALVGELAEGITGFIASYQLPVLVVLAAAISSRKRSLDAGQMLGTGLLVCFLIWASLVWTSVKPEYRNWLAQGDPSITEDIIERVSWIGKKIGGGEIDYSDALRSFVSRTGYTHFYALALPNLPSADTSFWLNAITNVLMPRALFGDKPALNDTAITTALTGVTFGEDTSVSIGFVAQTHADFGMGLMFPVLILLGYLMGSIARFFQTRKMSQIARDGFMSAALVYKFIYEQNVDKAIGSLFLSTIALMLVAIYVYPRFEKWAAMPQARTDRQAN